MDTQQQTPRLTHGRITMFHMFVVALSLVLTLSAWQLSKAQIEKRIGLRFETARDSVAALIVDRMTKYEDALWGGVAAVESHGGDISYDAWHTFARTLRIGEKYPGINGIGVIHFLREDTFDAYLVQQRQERPEFSVRPAHDGALKMPITFIEPAAINAAAVGLDVAHEHNRRQAALASRDTGTSQITGPIVLVQDAASTPGFLFYAPFYSGAWPQTRAARREQILGAVYAPFVVHKLMEGLLAKDLRSVRFDIRDGDALIYDELSADDPQIDSDPLHTDQIIIDLYGRQWTIDIETTTGFRAENTFAQSTAVLVAGLVIEVLVIALLVLMSRANTRAVTYADRVSMALKRKTVRLDEANRTLQLKNEELEQFAYVASHDLRTPIRGIGSLTEMIEEDLEPYLTSDTAHPDVAENLAAIRARVARMNELTKGIMDFSKIDAQPQDANALDLTEVVQTLRVDFKLAEDQLILRGQMAPAFEDTFTLRRVLENLVGNAIKYHDGIRPLEVIVTARCDETRCHISVSDNGPGIEPKFSKKIFDVFQTLRTGNAPESTGIGLAIVKKAVERHGGTITLASTPGKGATFSFDWPRGTDQADEKKLGEAA